VNRPAWKPCALAACTLALMRGSSSGDLLNPPGVRLRDPCRVCDQARGRRPAKNRKPQKARGCAQADCVKVQQRPSARYPIIDALFDHGRGAIAGRVSPSDGLIRAAMTSTSSAPAALASGWRGAGRIHLPQQHAVGASNRCAERVPYWYTARRLNEPVYGFKTLVEEGTDRILGAHIVGRMQTKSSTCSASLSAMA
jgi:hypothetical protein